MIRILRSSVIIMLFTLTACVGAGKIWSGQSGMVLDEETGQPIEGAIVVARWIGSISALVDSQTVCYHLESATTDAQGRYQIPQWTKPPSKVHHNTIEYSVYKASYRYVREETVTNTLYLMRDTGSSKERIKYLRVLMNAVSCGENLRTEHTTRQKWLVAIHREAKKLAESDDEKDIVRNIRFYSAEMLALPSDKKITYEERMRIIEDYMKEYLP